ncbi:DUF1995 family protein [Lyngbya confervoides]|uniref:DUF1995 family protein n=1 Tax=Lyngbya confervoides BDU141951 TaxID=1574623 RepID=A0ABD4SZR8_9CYAN|nr:DUF1995 family protein [Lyngbya confervoides]MCM1981879.1 DUF1995 family protein [Lyngbya confervoides BDU141951]
MSQLPESLEQAVSQSVTATQAAIAAGQSRVQVELVIPELKPMGIAQQFLAEYPELGTPLKVFFPDAGAAALARRDWEGVPYILKGIKELLEPVQPEDAAFVLVAPSAVEVNEAETIANQSGDRPYILLNPQLQDVSGVGIGYAGRQLRERFLSTLETSYYLCPLAGGLLFRSFPQPWEIYQETETDAYQLLESRESKPSGEEIEEIFGKVGDPQGQMGMLQSLTRFLKSLSR